MHYDVIVLGLGAMGSAAARELARRGARVLGLEQFSLGHAQGSSHGQTRLIRQAYFEEARYVPLMKRAYELWDGIGAESGTPVFHRNGLLIVGTQGAGAALSGARAAALQHGVPLQFFDERELASEFPYFRGGVGARGVYEPGAGYLEVEKAVIAQARLAERAGAELHFEEGARDRRADTQGVTVTTARGTYRAERLVIAGGAWAPSLLKDFRLPLTVLRVPQFWFDGPEMPKRMPCFAFDRPEAFIYGFPDLGQGLKIADYHPPGEPVADPARVDRDLHASDLTRLQACIRHHLPDVSVEPRAGTVCLYTMTPDKHFILDCDGRVTFAAGFSGHGFKFAPVIGEILADLSERGESRHEIGFLRARRFTG